MDIVKEIQNRNLHEYALCGAYLSRKQINSRLRALEGRHFIYFLVHNKEIIYIGKSHNLYLRLLQHRTYKKFDYVYVLEFESCDVCKMEKIIIQTFTPKYNNMWANQRRYQTELF